MKIGNVYVVVNIVTKQICETFNVIFLRKYISPTIGLPVSIEVN